MKHREATAPTWGALRDASIATVTTAAGAWVLSKTGSPEVANAAKEFSGEFANVALGAAVGVGVFLRKLLSDHFA